MALPQKPIPQDVIYVPLDIDSLQNKEDFSLEIVKIAQGEPVIIKDSRSVASLLQALTVLFQISPEVVLAVNPSFQVQIFNLLNVPAIRPEEINTHFSEKIKSAGYPSQDKRVSQEINLEEIWKESQDIDEQSTLSKSLDKAIRTISFAEKTTLIGRTPSALFLLIQIYLQGKTQQLWYQETQESLAIKIY